ncbi:MAG: hypothetical protein CSA81_02620 [Acidobacteria bacterium]|nr:MAG: hypothetical protein CSA81_02620 [Acidobacteriota bacterium]PIE90568.1 MAG: hypothetical protein CR997_05625 [Acidobacteriota bacterium]
MSIKMLIISGPYEGTHCKLSPKNELLIGRGRNNSISLPLDPCLSTRHAKLKLVGPKIIIKDLNSSNGSFISGKKLSATKDYTVRDFLVLGSTLLKREFKDGLGQALDPVTIDRLSSCEKTPSSLISKAIKACKAAKKPYVDAACLLYVFFQEQPEIMKQVCSDFMIDPEFLKNRWKDNRPFDIPHSWLNDFISISLSQPIAKTIVFTPLARHILNQLGQLKGPNLPVKQLEVFLNTPFNLIYPLLDWEKSKARWANTLDKLKAPKKPKPKKVIAETISVKDNMELPDDTARKVKGQEELILPREFWVDLYCSFQLDAQQVILGHKGSGKSSILHRIFHPSSKILPQYRKRILYDSKVYLILNSEKKLGRFVKSIIRDLNSKDLVGIDHIDHLLMNLQNIGVERGPLIQALKKPSAKVIISLDMENRTMISGLLQSPQIHFIGNYLDQVRDEVYHSLLLQFQNQMHCFLSEEGKAFIKEVVIDPSPDNIGAIKDYLSLAVKKSGGITFPFHELSSQTLASGKLGRAFLMDVYNDWVGIPMGKSEKDTNSFDEDPFQVFAYQLEDLVQAFSKNALKIGLHYSDQTTSLADFRSLDKEEKLQQLKSQIVCLLTAYQHGFQKWFPQMWRTISPHELRKHSTNTRKLWHIFEEKADLIDAAYAEDQFNEATSRVFQEIYRNK